MTKLATITPINCITHEQDGDSFIVSWEKENGTLTADFEDGHMETLEYTARTLEEAVDTVYSLYAAGPCWIYEPEEVEV